MRKCTIQLAIAFASTLSGQFTTNPTGKGIHKYPLTLLPHCYLNVTLKSQQNDCTSPWTQASISPEKEKEKLLRLSAIQPGGGLCRKKKFQESLIVQ
jgi:hypothetical protein